MLKLTLLSAFGFVAWFAVEEDTPLPLSTNCRAYANAASAQAVRELDSTTPGAALLAGRERLGRLSRACSQELGQ